MHNTYEEYIFSAYLINVIIIIMEAFSVKDKNMDKFKHMACILSVLSFLFKTPKTPNNTPVVNSLFQQRAFLENVLGV